MAPDPRAAFDRFVAALEAHLDAVIRERTDDSPAVIAATSTLIDAFETYDEALYDRYGVDTPFVVYDDSDEDDDEEEFDEDLSSDDEDDDEDEDDGDDGDDGGDEDEDDDDDEDEDEDEDLEIVDTKRR